MSDYVMSSAEPNLLPFDGDLMQGIPDTMPSDDDNAPPRAAPDGDRWPEHVAKHLGFFVESRFPVYWDGAGCHILYRSDSSKVADDLPARRFEYLALLDVCYERGITVAIPDAAALLQFYRLVQPMLTLQADARFRSPGHEEGYWQRGKSATYFYERDAREYQKKHPDWRPGKPRPRKISPQLNPCP